MALQALAYDRRDDVFEVAAARGGPTCRACCVTSSTIRAHRGRQPGDAGADDDRCRRTDDVRTVITIESEPEITG